MRLVLLDASLKGSFLRRSRANTRQEDFERLLRLLVEFVGQARTVDAVDAEAAKVVAQLAPCGQRPNLAPEVQAQRANDAIGRGLTVFARIVDDEAAARPDGAMHHVEVLIAPAEPQRVDPCVVHLIEQIGRHDATNASEC